MKGDFIMIINEIRLSRAISFCLCMLLPVFLFINIVADIPPVSYLYSIDSKGIHRRDAATSLEKTIFNTAGLYGVDFSVSPSDTVIALLISERGEVSPETHYYTVLPKNSMVFINPEGKEMGRLDADVRKFSWSPDGRKIAYITGTYYEGGVGFKTTGVWIFDLAKKSRKRIKKDFSHRKMDDFEGGGIEIRWASHDNNVYIRDFDYLDGIYRYSTAAGKSERVDYHGIDFSPDGKYYIGEQAGDTIHQRLYLSASNIEITDRLRERFGGNLRDAGFHWVFKEGHLMQFVKKQPLSRTEKRIEIRTIANKRALAYNVIYDIEANRVIKDVTLPVSRWKATPHKLVFEKDGELIVETYEDVFGRSR